MCSPDEQLDSEPPPMTAPSELIDEFVMVTDEAEKLRK
jgi:hypothetical protein